MPDKWDELLDRAKRAREERDRSEAAAEAARRAEAEAAARRIKEENIEAAARAETLLPQIEKALATLLLADPPSAGKSDRGKLRREYTSGFLAGERFARWVGSTQHVSFTVTARGALTLHAGRRYSLSEAVNQGRLRWVSSEGGYGSRDTSYSVNHDVDVSVLLEEIMAQIAEHIAAL